VELRVEASYVTHQLSCLVVRRKKIGRTGRMHAAELNVEALRTGVQLVVSV
jgi:hypothetical protein